MPNDIGAASHRKRNETILAGNMSDDAARADVMQPEVAQAALAGLTATPKTLLPKLFYDEEGCRLFYEITRLPEYYLTRTETALLQEIAPILLPRLAGGTMVEFGASDETKARILLGRPEARIAAYVPVDIAAPALQAVKQRLRSSNPHLRVMPVTGDFMQTLTLPPLTEPRFGFFPGSTIGNLDPDEAVTFMAAARRSLGSGAWFLLGADLRKNPDILLPAYDDAAGITAAFNLNVLRRLNREAGADFDLRQFRHRATWNDSMSRVELHLVSMVDQTAHVGGQTIMFGMGESIHTENSYKHTTQALLDIASKAGWQHEEQWQDRDGLFGILLLRAGAV